MLTKRSTNHIGHLILSILFFPWVIAWIMFYISNRNHNDEIDRMMWVAVQNNR